MTISPSTLILPVENQVRELDAKLLLACAAAERGIPVVLGSRTYVNLAMHHLPRGLFMAKGMTAVSWRMLKMIHGLGHAIVAWDEESLVRYTSPEYYGWRYSENTFGVIDHLFAWGADDAEFFASYPGYRGAPVHVTGNPRIDLLRPEVRGYFAPEVAALKQRYGDFILINTNFSFVNNYLPSMNLIGRDVLGQAKIGRTGRGMSLEFATGMAAHQQAIFDHFRALLPKLAGWFPGHRIVLRPHPSENHEAWRAVLADCPQVEVTHQGNVVPWLMAARVLLHNGCTTAVEASVLETPAVSYMPVTSEAYDYHLPNGLSHAAHTPQAVRDALAEILDGRRGLVDEAVRERLFGRHLAATRGPLACDRVLDALIERGHADRAPPRPAAGRWLKAWLSGHRRTLVKRLSGLRRDSRDGDAFHAHRFPGVTVAELNARIARLGKELGRFGSVRAAARSPHVFFIQDPEAATRRAGQALPRASAATSPHLDHQGVKL